MSNGIEKIVQRLGGKTRESLITETYRALERSKRDSGKVEETFLSKERETETIIEFVNEKNLWFENTPFSIYLDEGAEQKVFYEASRNKVIKYNDGIFYVNWSQFLESLIIHNLLFEKTQYDLIGFVKINSILYFVVEQEFIESTQNTELQNINKLMSENGFVIKKNNDYINHDLGLIIEDLHEQNVLTYKGELFFVDTVIYFKP